MRALVIGHSYIARLKDDIMKGKLSPDWPRETLHRVRFYGKRGGHINDMYRPEIMRIICRHRVQRVVIFCGGNDIGNYTTGDFIARQLIQLAQFYRRHVDQVVICNMIRRKKPRVDDRNQYNKAIDAANDKLKEWTAPDESFTKVE